jgi:hypothetical protein
MGLESQPVQPKDQSLIESLCRDRADVFAMPSGLAPGDEYFQARTSNGYADSEEHERERRL